ncbi:NADH:flavin oxidoreductase [Thermodesulfobacteriota bacterium]
MMSLLFEPFKIKNMDLKNRFVRSATGDGGADDEGHVSEEQVELYRNLAEGGVGLIITGLARVHDSGQIIPNENSIADDDCIKGLKKLTSMIHERDAKVAVQLFHAGRDAARVLNVRNEKAIAPSFIEYDPYFEGDYRSMTEDDIWKIINAFGEAAGRAREADFDAVQLNGAHGYLISQFLSPYTNRRDDEWGGALENRARFLKEVYRAVREKVGEDFPVLIKIGVKDEVPGGLGLEEGKLIARRSLEKEAENHQHPYTFE